MATPPTAAEVHRKAVELYNTGRSGEGLDLIDPDVIDHRGGTSGDHHGIEAWRRKAADRRNSTLHDMSVTVEQNVSAGEFSVNRYRNRGTDKTTGRGYDVTGMDMIRVRDGRIVEHWAFMDVTAMRSQLEGDPAD